MKREVMLMGIYKVIQIKLSKCVQTLQKKNQKKKPFHHHTNIKSYLTKNHAVKKKKSYTKNQEKLFFKQTAVLLFLLLLLAKGFSIWEFSAPEQTAQQTHLFLRDSLPY